MLQFFQLLNGNGAKQNPFNAGYNKSRNKRRGQWGLKTDITDLCLYNMQLSILVFLLLLFISGPGLN